MKTLIYLLLASACLGAPIWVEKGANLPAGLIQKRVGMTGSMRPALHGGEAYWVEAYHGQELRVGDWIEFFRASDGVPVLHEITALNKRAVYTSGIACRYSDGWSPRKNVFSIVRFVERLPLSHLRQVR